jgi:hypothetical protein
MQNKRRPTGNTCRNRSETFGTTQADATIPIFRMRFGCDGYAGVSFGTRMKTPCSAEKIDAFVH